MDDRFRSLYIVREELIRVGYFLNLDKCVLKSLR